MINQEVLLVAGEGPHGQQELGQVVAVQSAGLGGQAAGQVCVPHAYHSLQCVPSSPPLTVSTLQIDSC